MLGLLVKPRTLAGNGGKRALPEIPGENEYRPKQKHGSLATRPRWDWFLSRSRDFPARGEHEMDRSRSQTLRTPNRTTKNGRASETAARAPRRRYSSADTRRRVHGLDRGPYRLVRAWVEAAAAEGRAAVAGVLRARVWAAERR